MFSGDGVAVAESSEMEAEVIYAIESALRHATRAQGKVFGLTLSGEASADDIRVVLERQGLGQVDLVVEPGPGPLRLVAVELSR